MEMVFRDDKGTPISVTGKIIEQLLYNDERALTSDESKALYVDFVNRNSTLKQKGREKEFKKALKNDPYYNAFKMKFGYAITCHKAQGSEWQNVLVSCLSPYQNTLSMGYFRWLYTAITRTSSNLYVLNEPRISLGGDSKVVGGFNWDHQDENESSAPIVAGGSEHLDAELQINPMLRNLYQKVQACINSSEISISEVSHYQYQERYYFVSDDQSAQAEFRYNGKGEISYLNVNGSGLFEVALKSLLSPLLGIRLSSVNTKITKEIEFTETFLEEFHDRVIDIYQKHDICIADLTQNQWVQRYSFEKNGEMAVIDFFYNSKKQFGKVHPQPNLSTSKLFLAQTVQAWMNA